MRKTLIASAMAAVLASGPAFAAFDGVEHGSKGGAVSISGAVAASSGNGSSHVWTGGKQTAIYGSRGSSSSSFCRREGHATVAGYTAASGWSATKISTSGSGFGAGGTIGKSAAESGGAGMYDTHFTNPEGLVVGGSVAKNINATGGISTGNGYVKVANESGTESGYFAHSEGNRDGGFFGRPRVDTTSTKADAFSNSYDNSGHTHGHGPIHGSPIVAGGAIGGEWSATYGSAGALAFGKVGNTTSTNSTTSTTVR